MPTVKPLQIKTTDADRELIALVMAMYPNPRSMAEAVRHTLRTYIRNADPVAVEQARKAMAKARKEQAK
jgi:hypothetical protein